jgi:hypothetical protein
MQGISSTSFLLFSLHISSSINFLFVKKKKKKAHFLSPNIPIMTIISAKEKQKFNNALKIIILPFSKIIIIIIIIIILPPQ